MKSQGVIPTNRKRGTVVSFLPRKGYGFIRDESNEQVFVHFSDIRGDGHKELEIGEAVEFSRIEGERGAQAKDVLRLAPPNPVNYEDNPNETRRKW